MIDMNLPGMRTSFCIMAFGFWAGALLCSLGTVRAAQEDGGGRIPVILDADIGSDIDDTWALALLLASPELDLKLVVTDHRDTVARARVAALRWVDRDGYEEWLTSRLTQ